MAVGVGAASEGEERMAGLNGHCYVGVIDSDGLVSEVADKPLEVIVNTPYSLQTESFPNFRRPENLPLYCGYRLTIRCCLYTESGPNRYVQSYTKSGEAADVSKTLHQMIAGP